MKKFNILLILALTVIFVQCKKDDKSFVNEPVGGTEYSFSLYAGSNGAKTDINIGLNGSTVTWSEGDRIYVGNETGFLGCLALSGVDVSGNGTFNGTISLSEPIGDEGMTLHFYYLGETVRNINAGDESFTIDFSHQDGTLDGIEQNFHVGYGSATITSVNIDNNNNVVSASTSFTTKIAIAYMNLDGFAGEDVALSGSDIMKTMTVNFKTGECSYSNNANIFFGQVTSGTGKYIALLPTTSNSTILKFNAQFRDGKVEFLRGIEENKFYKKNDGSAITVNMTERVGALSGEFTVNADGKKVRFSRGNLQYKANPATWRFAESQYDFVGDESLGTVYENSEKCDNARISESYDGWIDLFGWGTSGYDDKNPYMTSTTNTYYGDGANNISGTYYDWGVHIGNAIANGASESWRTLTGDEWRYLLSTRTDAEIKRLQSTVCDVPGLIILPDNWTTPTGISFTGNANDYTSNNYNASQWSSMEHAGAVFLPAAGCRRGTSVSNVGTSGGYWSSSYSEENGAYGMYFDWRSVYPSDHCNRYYGQSVRLVTDY